MPEPRREAVGMAGVVQWFVPLMRRTFALVAVVLLSGMLPLAASVGFCGDKPCCRSRIALATASLGAPRPCCNETNCSAARDTEATNAKGASVRVQFPVVVVTTARTLITSGAEYALALPFTGSPPTARRLATLSILLI